MFDDNQIIDDLISKIEEVLEDTKPKDETSIEQFLKKYGHI